MADTTDRRDGGPAFPVSIANETWQANRGMSLRAWLAGQALAGLCANPNVIGHNPHCGFAPVNCQYGDIADLAVVLADVALAELDKEAGK